MSKKNVQYKVYIVQPDGSRRPSGSDPFDTKREAHDFCATCSEILASVGSDATVEFEEIEVSPSASS